VPHKTRTALPARFPVHVTLKLRPGLPSLRRRDAYAVLVQAFDAVNERPDFRVVHHSVQSNHVHLLCEAGGRRALSRGVQSLAIRIVKRLNRLWQRAGKLFVGRYHEHVLRSPSEVRNALDYLRSNARKHGLWLRVGRPDPFASSAPMVRARSWLLSAAWPLARAPT
jgi:REP element-mobilizing transposase RayT